MQIASADQSDRRASAIAALRNTGLLCLNDRDQFERTLIVLGAARSGTSMVAGALHHLGIFMGEKLSPVYEDVTFSDAVEARDVSALEGLIEDRNSSHRIWGWKRPAAIDFVSLIEPMLRNPCYLIVFRDVFAIANRNRISMNSDVSRDMERSLEYYGKVVDLLKTTSSPCLLISFEKAMLDSDAFVRELASWTGVSGDDRLDVATRFVRPDPEDYLLSSRITEAMGFLDIVARDRVSGWALLRHTRKPARVILRVNGREVAAAAATSHRPDLLAKSLHPTGNCGFSIVLPPDRQLAVGDEVRVHVAGDVMDLNGSPRTFQG